MNPYVPTLAAGGTVVMVGYLEPLEPAFIERMLKADVKYRFVIDMASLKME